MPATAAAAEIDGDLAPPEVSNQSSGTITLVPDPDDNLACTIDAQSVPCSVAQPVVSFTNLPDGPHTFEFVDTGGAASSDVHEWTIDTVAPTVTINSGPTGTATSGTATFTFSAPGETGATFNCSLDGAAAAPCTSPVTYNALANGNHTFSVTAVDAATNASAPATRSWTALVDPTPPDTTITAAPPGINNLSGASVEFTSNEAGSTFQCSVNGGEFIVCTSPNIVSALVDGAITFQVRAVDPAGNVDPTPATAGWTRDTVAPAAPALAIGRRAGAAQNATGATGAFQTTTALRAVWNRAPDAAASEVQYRLTRAATNPDLGKWTPWQAGAATQADTTVGTGITGCFRARSVDAAGNASAWTVKCTTVPYKATSASVKSPFGKRKGSGYFAGQYVRYTGSGRGRGYLRLQLTPRGPGRRAAAGLTAGDQMPPLRLRPRRGDR